MALALAVGACSGSSPTAAPSALGPVGTASLVPAEGATPVPSAAALVSPVQGVLTHVDSAGLAAVKGFTLLTRDGQTVAFKLGVLENGVDFPPGHLVEHMSTAEPVLVYFRTEGTDLIVYRIEDASAAASPSPS